MTDLSLDEGADVVQTVFDFNVFVGAETGFLKGINFNRKCVIAKNFVRGFPVASDSRQIASLSWSDPSKEEEVLVGFQNQKICLFDTSSNCYAWSQTYNLGDGPLVSTFKIPGHTVAALKSGEVGIIGREATTIINTLSGNKTGNSIKPTICQAVPSVLHSNQITVGGCQNDLSIWDINNTSLPIYKAKNVRPDMLDLRAPIWISDLAYLPNSDLIASCTRHKHVRLYDHRAQRRPVINFEFEDNPLISLAVVPSADKQVVVGSNHGRMVSFDFRKANPVVPVFNLKSFAGAIKGIQVHEQFPLVFSVSLDRFIRVHNFQTRKLVYKQFLKSRLTSLLVRKDIKEEDFIWRELQNWRLEKIRKKELREALEKQEQSLEEIEVMPFIRKKRRRRKLTKQDSKMKRVKKIFPWVVLE